MLLYDFVILGNIESAILSMLFIIFEILSSEKRYVFLMYFEKFSFCVLTKAFLISIGSQKGVLWIINSQEAKSILKKDIKS